MNRFHEHTTRAVKVASPAQISSYAKSRINEVRSLELHRPPSLRKSTTVLISYSVSGQCACHNNKLVAEIKQIPLIIDTTSGFRCRLVVNSNDCRGHRMEIVWRANGFRADEKNSAALSQSFVKSKHSVENKVFDETSPFPVHGSRTLLLLLLSPTPCTRHTTMLCFYGNELNRVVPEKNETSLVHSPEIASALN